MHSRWEVARDTAFRLGYNWSAAYSLSMRWRVILEPDTETGDWAAWCPELKGCASAGRTRDEAIENVKEAIALYLEPLPIDVPPGSVELRIAV